MCAGVCRPLRSNRAWRALAHRFLREAETLTGVAVGSSGVMASALLLMALLA